MSARAGTTKGKNMNSVTTISGTKWHYSADNVKTLCGRDVANGTDKVGDACKTCCKNSAKWHRIAEIPEKVRSKTVRPAPDADTIKAVAVEAEIPFTTQGAEDVVKPNIFYTSDAIGWHYTEEPACVAPVVPENIIHLIQHAKPLSARTMWRRIAEKKYGKHVVAAALKNTK